MRAMFSSSHSVDASLGIAPSRRHEDPATDRIARILFALAVVWGASIFWLAPHPPMVDLPQHAGQVSLLKDLLLGKSPWAEVMQVNLLTPYLIGYGLALPLALVLPVAIALKILLSAAYIGFVCLCVALRRHFDADSRLDWLCLVSFFGFAYSWGFLTFLVAAPIGLLFILLSDRYATLPTAARGVWVLGVGLVLLASHGLTFVFGWTVGALLVMVRARSARQWLRQLGPHAALAATCLGYFLISRHFESSFKTDLDSAFDWRWHWDRLPRALIYTSATHWMSWLPAIGALLLPCFPWLLGLRIDPARRSTLVAFAVVMAILMFAPFFAMKTAFLNERFALFLMPAYAWMFTRCTVSNRPWLSSHGSMARIAWPLMIATCLALLSMHSMRAWRFGQETAAFDAMLSHLEPGQRGLSLMFDRSSDADRSKNVYLHYAAWYQAEKQGLIDFNFAWFVPQVARFRPERAPAVGAGFEWAPESFDWQRHRGADYRYFFVRHSGRIPAGLFQGADCLPVPVVTLTKWTVFERSACR